MNGRDALSIVKATGRSQAEVGRIIGVSPAAMQKWKTGDVAGTTASLLMLIKEVPEALDILARIKRAEKNQSVDDTPQIIDYFGNRE